MARVLNTRFGEDAGELAAVLEACGHVSLPAPLAQLAAVACDWPGDADAIVLTSRQAARFVPYRFHDRAVFAIGPRTAAAARAAGFSGAVHHGDGEYDTLLELLKQASVRRLLYACGETVRHDLAADAAAFGASLGAVACYRMVDANPWPDATRMALDARSADAALLFSPAMASRFHARAASAASWLPIFAMSRAVADALGNWRHLAIAPTPSLCALLACAGLMCDEGSRILRIQGNDG